MITVNDYLKYFNLDKDNKPNNFNRLLKLADKTLKAQIVHRELIEENSEDYIMALCEQIYYIDNNMDIFESNSRGNYTLGSYSESGNSNNQNNNTNKLSPIASTILLECGLLYCGL